VLWGRVATPHSISLPQLTTVLGAPTVTDTPSSLASSQESSSYAALGASSAKAGVLAAVGESGEARYFAAPLPDIAGDPNAAFFLHADGAGTKSIIAYLAYRESNDPVVFASLAYDSTAMNTDDVACAGGVAGLALSNTIGRNRNLVPDEAIAEIIRGYRECCALLASEGLPIHLAGGETADLADIVRTLVVDSTLCARVPRASLVDTTRVSPGDLIVGFSSTGRARFEKKPNSGIGSNGLTLARHALLKREYAARFPEVVDPLLSQDVIYRGSHSLQDTPEGLGMSIQDALLSPTRPYAPLIKVLLSTLGPRIHALFHMTGGGQTKNKRFGKGVCYEKDNLFPVPPIFSLIQQDGGIPWAEMYAVFNMGHRLEAVVEPEAVEQTISLSEQFGIAARVVGRVTSSKGGNEVVISSPHGTFRFS
jgi:phosphoribosylformylglycinamidine cyclo-ligase